MTYGSSSLVFALLLLSDTATAFSLLHEQQSRGFAAKRDKNYRGRHQNAVGRPKTTTSLHAMEQLVFKGDYVATTAKLPDDTTKQEIADFFAKPANRNIFLSAGGKRSFSTLEMTTQFKDYWRDICVHFNSKSLPDDKDTLLAVDAEVKFPGMKLVTTTVNGIKELYTDDADPMLRGMEALMVAERSEAQGATPVVWLFNKLTGNDKREKDAFYPPKQTKARSIVTVQELADDSSLALTFKLQMQVTVEFPSVLIKILPTSKEKMEEQGSSSSLKAVSKDVDSAMEAAYNRFMKERPSSEV